MEPRGLDPRNSLRSWRGSTCGFESLSSIEALQAGLRPTHSASVEAMERCGNSRPRVERLVSAWNEGVHGDADLAGESDDLLIGASAEPKKRPRTRLTDEEVDAMRTARAQGVSVIVLARRFGVHRGTVWAKTREG